MTKLVLRCASVLALISPSPLLAQAVEEMWEPGQPDDYEAYFGSPDKREAGPASLDEARKQGRGYRIGSSSSPVLREPTRTHRVVAGDTLWDICDRYFGDPWQWPRVWSYNPEITNPHWIYPDTYVRLTPDAGGAGQGLAENNAGPTPPPNSMRVVIVSKDALTPGTVFLRDQGYLDDDALKSLGVINGAPEERMALSVGDNAYVKFSPQATVKPGDEFAVFRSLNDWERFPTEQGRLVKITGSVLVRSYDPNTHVARVEVVEALDGIERGSNIAKVTRRFDLVPPRENTAQVEAHIVASTKPRGLLSYGDVVFLDVGEGRGVNPGNRFFVVRRRDEYLEAIQGHESESGSLITPPEYHPEEFPSEVIAELRVVKVRKKSTIALVTRSDTDFTYGDAVEMRKGY